MDNLRGRSVTINDPSLLHNAHNGRNGFSQGNSISQASSDQTMARGTASSFLSSTSYDTKLRSVSFTYVSSVV